MSFELDVQMTVSSFPELKKMFLEDWPQAFVLPINLKSLDLKDKTFLHFGCGEGEIAANAVNYGAKLSVGFNAPKGTLLIWENQHDKLLLTSNWQKIHTIRPYDVILIDGLLERQKDVKRMLKATYFLAEMGGTIYLRCRSWSGPNGGVLDSNKAFAHLVFSPNELEVLGVHPTECQEAALEDYEKWFDDVGFVIKSKTVSTYDVPDFFKNSTVSARLEESLGENYFNRMQIDFCDYILEK